MSALKLHKGAHYLWKKKVPLFPTLIHYLIRLLYSSIVNPSTIIGDNCRLSYGGVAVIIHKRAKIGNNVIIGSCVTIGGKAGYENVPIIEDDVYIGSGAKVLGPITIHKGAVIGANAVMLNDVVENTVVAGVPAKVIKVLDKENKC